MSCNLLQLLQREPLRLPPINFDHACNVLLLLSLGHPSRLRGVRVVRHGIESPDGAPDGDDATENEEPPPSSESGHAVQSSVDRCLQVPTEHVGSVACGVKDCNAL